MMKRILAVILAMMMLFSIVSCSKKQEENADAVSASAVGSDPYPDSMVQDGTFDTGEMKWGLYTESNGEGTLAVENNELVLTTQNKGTCSWAVQAYYDGVSLVKGADYMFRFDVRSDVPKNFDAIIQINGGDYHPYVQQKVTSTPDAHTEDIRFTMTYDSDIAPRLCFNCGIFDDDPAIGSDVSEYKIYFDNIYVVCLTPDVKAETGDSSMCNVNLDQIGYLPKAEKVVIVRGDVSQKEFYVKDSSGNVVYTGSLSDGVKNDTADETDYYGYFTDLTTPGEYTVETADGESSYPFKIGSDVYYDAYNDIVKLFYLQRCGCELDSERAGEYAHDVCHNGDAIIYGTNDKIDVSGGWHDAGDYGRYVVSGAKAAMDLMLAYEEDPQKFGDKTGIPESGNNIPDVLDEVRYEIEWMFKMQAKNGGVYHKVTAKNFPGFVSPEKETEQLYVCPISSCATGDFAAVMAHAYTVYKSTDAKFADECLKAAVKAWDYLESNPFDGKGFKNPSDISTGEYPDGQDIDERYWAACELLAATGEKKYSDYVDQAIAKVEESLSDSNSSNDLIIDNLGWANVGLYGSIAYLSADNSVVNADTRAKILAALTETADKYVDISKKDGYFVSMGNNYPWGSNMNIMNNAMAMLFANKFAPNADYVFVAQQHMHYIFGANSLATSFVTGYGTVAPDHPHHRPSQAVGKTVPGMMVGGVNSNREDPYASVALASAPPAKCYCDNDQSYSTNEICVYWNSPLVYVMSACCFE